MDRHDFEIPVTFTHRVIFGRDVFGPENTTVSGLLREGGGRRVLVFVETALTLLQEGLVERIETYFGAAEFDFRGVQVFEGGEPCKADEHLVQRVRSEINHSGVDRHSYVLVIGGGAFLDAVGFAASTAHRGVRLLRFPTTTLSQDDSGVGVKNAINAFGKKNWVGSFAVPFAVVNDFDFLETQSDVAAVTGLIEAVKVALVKDREFFEWIEKNCAELKARVPAIFEECVKRSALLHAEHIAHGGDAFENGSSRPLDFGHWAAHKLEALSEYRLTHAEAVSVGIALDTVYSRRKGFLDEPSAAKILSVLERLDLATYHPGLDALNADGVRSVVAGLDEFREHLGGRLTVLLLREIGDGRDVHEIDTQVLAGSIDELRDKKLLALTV